jgi:D-arabinose 1-dehydrogenase-like Zn-dependent alcohol dehydrogenase
MVPGTILGHEAVGVVQEVGSNVRNLKVGDR